MKQTNEVLQRLCQSGFHCCLSGVALAFPLTDEDGTLCNVYEGVATVSWGCFQRNASAGLGLPKGIWAKRCSWGPEAVVLLVCRALSSNMSHSLLMLNDARLVTQQQNF